MPETKPYYRILQVDPAAEPEVITAAYRRLALKYHPDSDRTPGAVRRMQEINEAYEILSDPVKRERYNLLLSAQQRQSYQQPAHRETTTRSTPEPSQEEAHHAAAGDGIRVIDQQLGCSFLVVYSVVALLLFRVFFTRIASIWVIGLVLIAAALITIPVVFKIDDFLRRG